MNEDTASYLNIPNSILNSVAWTVVELIAESTRISSGTVPSQTSRRNSVVAAGEDVNVDGEWRIPPKVDIVGNNGLACSAYGGSLRPTLVGRCGLPWSGPLFDPSNFNSQQNDPQTLLWTAFTTIVF